MRVKLFKRMHGKAKLHQAFGLNGWSSCGFHIVNQSQSEPLAAFYLCTFIVLAGERQCGEKFLTKETTWWQRLRNSEP